MVGGGGCNNEEEGDQHPHLLPYLPYPTHPYTLPIT